MYRSVSNIILNNNFCFKGRVHCFSMQVVINPEKKNWRRSVLSFSRKMQKTHNFISKNDDTESKVRLYSLISNETVNRLKVSFRLPKTMVSEILKLTFNLLTAF